MKFAKFSLGMQAAALEELNEMEDSGLLVKWPSNSRKEKAKRQCTLLQSCTKPTRSFSVTEVIGVHPHAGSQSSQASAEGFSVTAAGKAAPGSSQENCSTSAAAKELAWADLQELHAIGCRVSWPRNSRAI